MASACVNNPPPTYPSSSYSWLTPRMSFSREDDSSSSSPHKPTVNLSPPDLPEFQDLAVDFEFHLEDPVTMLPADELFSDGKLMPLQVSTTGIPKLSLSNSSSSSSSSSSSASSAPGSSSVNALSGIRSLDGMGGGGKSTQITDPYMFSPKVPRCSSRWKEILGLKKLYHQTQSNNNNNSTSSAHHNKTEPSKTSPSICSSISSSTSNPNPNPKSPFKHFLRSKPSSTSSSSSSSSSSASLDCSLSLPLLKDTDYESLSFSSSRLSLSSSSSSHDHEDLPRLSLDSEKPSLNSNPFILNRNQNITRVKISGNGNSSGGNGGNGGNLGGAGRAGRSPMSRAAAAAAERESNGAANSIGLTVDSPRMNSSGKIVFQNLERSSSSPSTFNGGPRYKHRGMERSYSANVRVAPVLNVPVSSLRGSSSKSGGGGGNGSVFGFGQLFSSPQTREGGGIHKANHHHHHQYTSQQQQSSRNNKRDL